MGYLYNTLAYLDETYRAGMKAIKKSEQLTPKEYGMRLQEARKRERLLREGSNVDEEN